MNMSPLESSLAWWSGWSDILGITAASIGAILAIVTLVGWGFSWKAGKLKDEALEKYKIESRRSISEADAKAAGANERAANAELETQRLKKQLAWREVTQNQATTIRTALQNTPMNLTISWVAGDPEGSEFAQQLGSVFAASGITLVAFAPMGYLGEEPHGVSISGSERQEIMLLSTALEKAGLGPVAVRIDAKKPDGTKYFTHLNIGYRVAPILDERPK